MHYIFRESRKITTYKISTGERTVHETEVVDKFVTHVNKVAGSILYADWVNNTDTGYRMYYQPNIRCPQKALPFTGSQAFGAISPDNTRIAIVHSDNKSVFYGSVIIYNIASGASEIVVPAAANVIGVDWMPDGSGIYYNTWDQPVNNGGQLSTTKGSFYKKSFGQSAQLITTYNNTVGPLKASPDGTKLAFSLYSGGYKVGYISSSTGALTVGPNYHYGGLDWNMAGTGVLYGVGGISQWITANNSTSILFGASIDTGYILPVFADPTPPTSTIAIIPSPNGMGWSNSAVSVSLSAADNASGSGVKEIRYTLDMGSEQVVSAGGASFPISSEGMSSVAYWSIDNENNTEATNSKTVRIDKTAPSVSASVTSGLLTVNATDTLSGVASVQYALDNGAFQNYSGPVNIPSTAKSLRTKATDNAGNTSATNTQYLGQILKTLTVTPNPAYAGSTVTVKVDLTGPAPTGGLAIQLASGDSAVLPLPATVNVPAGASTASTSAVLGPVPGDTQVLVTAAIGDNRIDRNLTVLVPTPKTLIAKPSVVAGGANGSFALTLVSKAPAGGQVVTLTSLNPAVLTVPASVTVAAGQTAKTFPATTSPVSSDTSVLVVAEADGDIAVCAVAVRRNGVASLTFTPPTVTGGTSSQLKIVLSRPAPVGGTIFGLSAIGTGATVPASIAVPAGATSATVSVSTSPTAVERATVVRVQTGGVSARAILTILPARLASVLVSPSSVPGGTGTTGTVVLSGTAPAGGLVVKLASAQPGIVTVPASVTVPAGAASASFAITTTAVSANTPVVVSASQNLDSKSATVTVLK